VEIGEDRWVCGTCRSINSRRSDHCYRCHAPRVVAEVDPRDLPSADHATEVPSRPLNPYRSARDRAIVASILIVAASVVSIAGWLAQSQAILAAIDVEDQATADTPERAVGIAFDAVIPVSHLQLPLTALWVLLAVAALVAWAAWLSRVVDNLPALGVGYARVSPQMAFVENFLMGRNLYSMPARVREVTQKLHPAGGGDEILAAAWLALFGSIVGGRFGFYVARILSGTEADYLRARIVVGGLTTVVALVGYVLVVGVIRRVERLSEERAAGSGAEVAVPAAAIPPSLAAQPTSPATPNALAPSATSATSNAMAPPPDSESPPSPAANRPAASFAAGRTVEFLAQRSAASPGTSTGGADEARSSEGRPGRPSDEPRPPA
jgi:hypothetical protein